MVDKVNSNNYPLGVILAGAFILRVIIGAGQDLWDDEVASILVAQAPLLKLGGYYKTDPHPPLYFTILKTWTWISLSTWWLRLFPAIIGTINVWLLYLWTFKSFGKKAGLIAGALLALAPFHVWGSTELRSHSLVALFVTAGAYLVSQYIEKPNRKLYFFTGTTCIILATWTHYFAFAPALGIFAALAVLSEKRKTDAPIFVGLITVSFLPWLPFFISQISKTQSFREITPPGDWLFSTFIIPVFSEFPWRPPNLFILGDLVEKSWFVYITIVALLATVFWFMVIKNIAKKSENKSLRFSAIILFFSILLVFTGSRIVPGFESRYLLFLLPVAIFIIVAGQKDKTSPPAKVMLTILIICFVLANLSALLDAKSRRPDFSGLVKRIQSENGLALIYNSSASPAFIRHALLRLDVRELRGPYQTKIGDVESLVTTIEPKGKSLFLVGSNSEMYDPDKRIRKALAARFGKAGCFDLESAMTVFVCRYKPKEKSTTKEEPTLNLILPF